MSLDFTHRAPSRASGDFFPPTDDTYDLGSLTLAWQDGFFDGVLYTDTISEFGSGVGVTIDGVKLKDSEVYTDVVIEKTSGTGVTIDGVKLKDSEPYVDVINEKTSATGVTIDGVKLKDSQVYTDTINEKTTSAGVTLDGVKLVDNYISFVAATLPAGTVAYLGRDNTNDLTANVPTGGAVNFAVNGIDVLSIAGTLVTVAQSAQFNGYIGVGIAPASDQMITAATTFAEISAGRLGVVGAVQANKTSGTFANTLFGVYGQAVVDAANSVAWTGTPAMVGVAGDIQVEALAAGVIARANNFWATSSIGAATITTLNGLYVSNATGAGTVTNQYGIFIEDMTKGGTLDIGIAIAGADTVALWLGSGADNTGAADGIMWGASRDTNLYRSTTNTLKTDDTFVALAYQVADVQVVGARQIDARINDTPNSGDVTTDGIIAALQACVQTHGLMAAA